APHRDGARVLAVEEHVVPRLERDARRGRRVERPRGDPARRLLRVRAREAQMPDPGRHGATRASSSVRGVREGWNGSETRPSRSAESLNRASGMGAPPLVAKAAENSTGPWGSVVSLVLGVHLTPVQIWTDPLLRSHAAPAGRRRRIFPWT